MGFVKKGTIYDPDRERLPKPLPGETKKEARQGRHPVNYKKKPAAPKVKQVDEFDHLKLG